ncbi:unnamed protein product [Linum trigynum]|uniref:Uncharacterized protein n=1 Tax=Linum trigynum TaxID=586398 RepID=A0AAV2FWI2_9ROSI
MGKGVHRFIEVSQEGVDARNKLLDRCLVLSYSSKSGISFNKDWVPSFRRWAIRFWAIDENFVLEDCLDGRWLLIFPSIADALRIKKINILKFREFLSSCSLWKDGEMSVCGDESWIVALDIPLHLKSVDLLVAIGKFCGVFVDLDWDSWFLPFVRTRIKKTTAIPDVIPLRFDGLEFPIQIVSLAATPLGLPCNTIISAGINSHARVSGTLPSHPD